MLIGGCEDTWHSYNPASRIWTNFIWSVQSWNKKTKKIKYSVSQSCSMVMVNDGNIIKAGNEGSERRGLECETERILSKSERGPFSKKDKTIKMLIITHWKEWKPGVDSHPNFNPHYITDNIAEYKKRGKIPKILEVGVLLHKDFFFQREFRAGRVLLSAGES